MKATPKSQKIPSRSKPNRQTKILVKRVKFEEYQQVDDSKGHNDSGYPTYVSSEDNIEVQSSKETSDVPVLAVELQIFKVLGCTSMRTTTEEETFYVVRYPRPSKHVIQPHTTRNLTRKEIEEWAWRNAKLRFPDGNIDFLPPPSAHVEISVIYVPITEAFVQ